MFENTLKTVEGDCSRETVKASTDELVSFVGQTFQRLNEGEGPVTREVILEAMGSGADELRAMWEGLDANVNLDINYQMLVLHPDLVADASFRIYKLTTAANEGLTRRLGLDNIKDMKDLQEKSNALAATFASVNKELGVPTYDQEMMSRLSTEHPEAIQKFVERIDKIQREDRNNLDCAVDEPMLVGSE